MGQESIRMSAHFPVSPERIYEAWLDGDEHGKITGAKATVEPRVGGAHVSWDGYIKGENLALEAGRRILQTWRTLEFPADSGDSKLEVLLAAKDGGTEMTIVHTEIPEGQGSKYEMGWRDLYFTPMTEYFTPKKAARAEAKPAAKTTTAATKKPAAKKAVAKKPVAKKAVAKKPVAKKPVAKKAGAKKPVAKKAGARKPATKQAATKKAAARPATKKPGAKKPAAKKSAAKKPAAKKPVAKKPVAKKPAAKKR